MWLEILLFATTALLFFLWTRRPKNYPPGPWSLPLLGTVPALFLVPGDSPHETLWTVAKRYGPVAGLFMGTKPVVVITGYDAVKHVLARDDLAFRPNFIPAHAHFIQRRLGVFFTDGPAWREQRRFTLRHLRDFGFGRQTMEALIHEEARALLEAVEVATRSTTGDVDLLPLLPVHTINILWTIIAGRRHDVADKDFLRLTQAVLAFFRNGSPLNPVNNNPILQKIPLVNASFKRQIAGVRQIQDFVEASIAEHMRTFDEEHMRDFIDVYIREMRSQSDQPESSFFISQLCMVCMDMFNAGTETTASTLGYCVRYMVQYPHVQSKLRVEIEREVGLQRLPAMNDMTRLPYAQAVLSEVLRHSGLAPFTVPHATCSDVDILGYHVPKGTMLLINLWSVHMDPEIWGDPEVFRPERFINDDGSFRKDEHLIAFGTGPRMCLGEPLARYTTFLLFTALLQNFKFHVPPQGAPPSNEQLLGFTTSPAPYRVAITRVE